MIASHLKDVPRIAALPRIYRWLLTLTRRHGLFTLARWHHRWFKGGQIVRLPGGEWLFIPGDSHYFGFLTGLHEEHVRRVIDQYVNPGDVCVDVGANIGYFAMMMAGSAGQGGKVIAFEPVQDTYEVLSANATMASEAGRKLTPIHAAISSANGQLFICRNAHSTLHQVSTTSGASREESESVPAMTLVSALASVDCNEPITLLKIDVEGHELAVLEGALPLFQSGRVRRMIIEVTPGEEAAAIARLLTGCRASYRCWLGGQWEGSLLESLPWRTDVLVEFPHSRPQSSP